MISLFELACPRTFDYGELAVPTKSRNEESPPKFLRLSALDPEASIVTFESSQSPRSELVISRRATTCT